MTTSTCWPTSAGPWCRMSSVIARSSSGRSGTARPSRTATPQIPHIATPPGRLGPRSNAGARRRPGGSGARYPVDGAPQAGREVHGRLVAECLVRAGDVRLTLGHVARPSVEIHGFEGGSHQLVQAVDQLVEGVVVAHRHVDRESVGC